MSDNYDFERFVAAQAEAYDNAIDILRRGAMCTPYMDFIFPRLARHTGVEPYALASLDEARAYLEFQPIGNPYRECVETLFKLVRSNAREVFGDEDARKLHASLTLFAEASHEVLLRSVLVTCFANLVDEDTIVRIGQYG